ncbi:sensor histidine kinase [Pengzhenrongella sicca]|uniref:GAF domain-containing protein n=1 Tax=Pengzhenrongella sicca TaxID=2819238 RepID=A0A8A4Z9X3_9MICO|nr:GAF domain-containing protein [Pengzhenrongella sicca]QTE28644.1 GAF domain-containing protein [Pengzhenrongella sicca]
MVPDGRTTPVASTDLLSAFMALSADLDLPRLLERFVAASTSLTGAQFGAINVLDEHGASVTFVQAGMPAPIVAALANPPHAIGVLGEIPSHGVLRLHDLMEHPAFRGLPAGHPPMHSFLGTAVRVGEEIFGYLYLSEKVGGFDAGDEAVVTALAAAAAIAIQNAQHYEAAMRREQWLRAGQQITTMLLEGADEEDALLQIASTAREIAHADTAALVLPGMGGELVMEIVDGRGREKLLGLTMARMGRSWDAFATGQGALVPSLATARDPQLAPLREFGPALYAPLLSSGHYMGVLVLLRTVGRAPFDASDLDRAQSFAAQAALAFVLAEARRTHDAAALLDERERIARDLHDLAIQQLFATGLQLETVRSRTADGSDPRLTRIVETALDNVDSSVRQIRVIVHALHNPDTATPLVERLQRECALARTGLGFDPALEVVYEGHPIGAGPGDIAAIARMDDVLGADLAGDVAAVAREGLANAARHAHSTTVWVRVSVAGSGRGGTVTIEVEDDGVGLSPERDRHSGTKNLATRAGRHGGTFTLGTPPSGRGTLVHWRAPLA